MRRAVLPGSGAAGDGAPMPVNLLRAFELGRQLRGRRIRAGSDDARRLRRVPRRRPDRPAMHSHIAGVTAAARGRDRRFAIKLHQRAWALRRGVPVIELDLRPAGRPQRALQPRASSAAEPVEYAAELLRRDARRHQRRRRDRPAAARAGSSTRAEVAAPRAVGRHRHGGRADRGGDRSLGRRATRTSRRSAASPIPSRRRVAARPLRDAAAGRCWHAAAMIIGFDRRLAATSSARGSS